MVKKLFERILTPFEQFLQRTTSGGIVLMAATVLTLIFANSKWGSFLFDILDQPIWIGIGSQQLKFTPHLLVNDGLMTVFFLVVGLELKREILAGELSSMRAAALPVFAALGGMVVPALIYYSLNREGLTARGWGIPMATDIAFAVGILVLIARRIPRNLIIFLTALAIADDLGAVLVIALFYTSDISLPALGCAAGTLAFLVLLNLGGTRHPIPYSVGGLLLWLAMLQSGIHATIAGVLLACTIPARAAFTPMQFAKRLAQLHGQFHAEAANPNAPDRLLSNPRMSTMAQGVEDAAGAVQSPLQRMEHALSPWVTFLIIPLFAISNVGIDFGEIRLGESLRQSVTLGVIFGLVAGKFLGISIFSWLAVKLRIGRLPAGVTWPYLLGVAWLGGIGFTMSLFISQLAFADPFLNEQAKLGILVASALSGGIGFLWLYLTGRISQIHGATPKY
ncbi:MAG: Na+/H+ antiporter NhaA [Syntrophobacteraceae bacterium]